MQFNGSLQETGSLYACVPYFVGVAMESGMIEFLKYILRWGLLPTFLMIDLSYLMSEHVTDVYYLGSRA
jgi:hypothetical protein